MSMTVPISSLPVDITPDEAVEMTYRDDLDWIEHKLRLGLSVLIDCDKQLTLYLYRSLRRRLRREPAQRCVLIAGQSAVTGEGPPTLIAAILAELREQVYSGPQGQILVLPHLDVLTTTTRSGLNAEAREAIAMVFENPNLVLLGFRDPLFEIPGVLTNVFAVRREVIGIPRDSLPRIITQREARKLGSDRFNPYALFKYVSGINAVRIRQLMQHLHDRVDFDPANPNTADEIYRDIRQMTVISDLELPSTSLRDDIGGYDDVKTKIEEEILELLRFKATSEDPEEIRRVEEIIPKGMIFLGPPGTGKTFFAKAIATALDATVQIVSGPELKSKWVGESLPWDEEVLVVVDGKPQRIPIGALVDAHTDDQEVLAWTARDNGVCALLPVTGFIRHEGPDYVDVLVTETGREVRVTGGHSLFVNKDGLLADVVAEDIVEGETRVAVPLRLHAPETLTEIDVAACFSGREDIFIQGYDDHLKRADAAQDDDLQIECRGGKTLTVKALLSAYNRPPVSIAALEDAIGSEDLDGMSLHCWHRNKNMPTTIPLDEDLGEFLGLWTAEGSFNNKGAVRLTIQKDEVEHCEALCRRLFGHVTVSPKGESDGVSLVINSNLLRHLMREGLHIQSGSHDKHAPACIFLAPKPVVAAFLRGYFSGDGTFNGKSIEATTVSKRLAQDVATLLQFFGIAARLRQRTARNGSTSHRVRFTWSAFLRIFANEIGFSDPRRQVKLREYVDNMTFKRQKQTLEDHITNDVLWDRVVEKRREPYARKHVYDLSVPGTERFVAGFGNILVHNSEENLRKVFSQARRSAPAVIVFDEIDSFATARGTYSGSGVEHSMVNQMLTEMDGFRKEELVFVIGTTNFAESLDPALLRPGRFELLIDIPYPERDDRRAIVNIYRAKFKLDMSDEMVDYIVDKTGGFVDEMRGVRFSGDHLYAVCRALKREELRKKSLTVTQDDIHKAINSRRKAPVKFSEAEERTIAIHEAGHAMCAHMLPYASQVEKITIATGDEDTLGYVMRAVKENKYITTRNELLDDICVLLGGRVAESLIIGDISVGAYDDLQKATLLARAMLEELGMGRTLGMRTIAGRQGIGRTTVRENVADATAACVDQEIVELLEGQRQRAEQLLIDKRELFDTLVETLMIKKTLEKDEIVELLGKPNKLRGSKQPPSPSGDKTPGQEAP